MTNYFRVISIINNNTFKLKHVANKSEVLPKWVLEFDYSNTFWLSKIRAKCSMFTSLKRVIKNKILLSSKGISLYVSTNKVNKNHPLLRKHYELQKTKNKLKNIKTIFWNNKLIFSVYDKTSFFSYKFNSCYINVLDMLDDKWKILRLILRLHFKEFYEFLDVIKSK